MAFIDDVERLKNNKTINKIIIVIILFIILIVSSLFMLRYYVEGESNLPFRISKIIVVSSAEGTDTKAEQTKWALDLTQNNDIYISIDKNNEYNKNETIKQVQIENIQIDRKQQLGIIKNYKPAKEGMFRNKEEYLIKDKIEYTGNDTSDINELKIGNNGGTIIFRSANTNIITYNTDEDEIVHNGTLLAKAGITEEQIEYKIKFDLIVETGKGIKYKGTINLKFPQGDMLKNGTGSMEKINVKDINMY